MKSTLMLIVTSRLQIPMREFTFTYARSSGPGGQNVNKLSTKAILRWPMRTSKSLPEAVRARFLAKFGNKLTTDGDLLITSQRTRDAGRNTADCLEKLRRMLSDRGRTAQNQKTNQAHQGLDPPPSGAKKTPIRAEKTTPNTRSC